MPSPEDPDSIPVQPSVYDQPPPLPPPEMPPLAQGSYSRPSSTYHFGGTSSLPEDAHQAAHQRNEFSFRTSNQAPQYPHNLDSYRPTRSSQHNTAERERLGNYGPSYPKQTNNQSGQQNRVDSRARRGRANRTPHTTADRPLLRFQRGKTPERMLGMNDDTKGRKRFLAADDISDSEEEAMEESESDQPELDGHNLPFLPETAGESYSRQDFQQTSGQERLEGAPIAVLVPDVPKWSNPDPYTALPPPDESQRRKKDVIKLIRKARVAVQLDESARSQVAANDDFISFDSAEALPVERDDRSGQEPIKTFGEGAPGAPSGPKALSHLHNPHLPPNIAPGTIGHALSAPAMGPPPASAMTNVSHTNRNDADTESRNQKRKRDEEDELSSPTKRQKGKSSFSNGSILEEWVCRKHDNPIPWVTRSHQGTEHAGFRLHKEICDFYDFVKPQAFEHAVRQELLQRLQTAIKKYSRDCELRCFGSFAAGLYLPNADMDLVVNSKQFLSTGFPTVFQTSSKMHAIANHLKSIGIAEQDSIEVIPKAKVPLVKFIDRTTSLRVDLSFENTTGLIANDTFDEWKRAFPAMPIIVTLIKQFLMMRGLNEVVNGGLGGFSVTCLVVSLLQNLPQVQAGDLIPEQHLGEILMEFLDLYGNQIDISRTGIMMEPPGYFNKQHANRYLYKPDRLAILDPNKPSNDISGGSRSVMLIFDRLSEAHEEILRAMALPSCLSLLEWMLGGDYSSFLWQRKRLKKLYEKGYYIAKPASSNLERTSIAHKAAAGSAVDSLRPTAASSLVGRLESSLKQLVHDRMKFTNVNIFKLGHDPPRTAEPIKHRTPAQSAPENTFEKAAMESFTAPQPAIRQPASNKLRKLQVERKDPVFQEQSAVDLSQVKAGKKRNSGELAIRRADQLKAKYPGIKNVPHKLKHKAREKLIADYIEQHPSFQTPAKKRDRGARRKPKRLKGRERFATKEDRVGSSTRSKAVNVVTQLAFAAGGNSRSNPITID